MQQTECSKQGSNSHQWRLLYVTGLSPNCVSQDALFFRGLLHTAGIDQLAGGQASCKQRLQQWADRGLSVLHPATRQRCPPKGTVGVLAPATLQTREAALVQIVLGTPV